MLCRRATTAEVLPLRHAVLRAGLPPESARFQGDDGPQTRHFAAIDSDAVVGVLSVMVSPLEHQAAWQLRGMAVAAERRGQGIGGQLLSAALEDLRRDSDLTLVWCNARSAAVGFYRKHGWEVVSAEFMIEGVGPHFRMSRRLLAGSASDGSG